MSNTPRIRILPYMKGSKSAKALAEALGGKILRKTGSKFNPKKGDVVINWGSSSTDHPAFNYYAGQVIINQPDAVKECSNKLSFFQMIEGEDFCPEFWTNLEDIPEDAYPVVCRKILTGHSGEGIAIANSPEELVPAPLYVKYIKKSQEYRVHLVDDIEEATPRTFLIQRKARRTDVPDSDVNWQVRNFGNGFTYARDGFETPPEVIEAAKQAMGCPHLDFGAFDVIWNEHYKKAYVLEVNTAPGLAGSTVNDYAKMIQDFLS